MASTAALLVASGALAVSVTAATVCLEIVSGVRVSGSSGLVIALAVSAGFETLVLLILGAVAASRALRSQSFLCRGHPGLALALQLLACTAATASAASALVFMHRAVTISEDGQKTAHQSGLFIVTAAAVACASVLQIIFVVCNFVGSRQVMLGSPPSFQSHEEGRKLNIKTIRYSQTRTRGFAEDSSAAGTTSPTMAQPKQTFGPISSLRASVSQAIRPVTSRTKLLSSPDVRRQPSIDSGNGRLSTDTSFDSWDTSAVDAHSKQVVMEMTSSPTLKTQALETIPASPPGSRSPSPANALDLLPPRSIRRTTSYCSSSRSQRDLSVVSPTSSVSELHIHPLFRSDSPTVPPTTTPGTNVLAAPNAGQIITRRDSIPSLRRARSGSLPSGKGVVIRQDSLESLGSHSASCKTEDGDLKHGALGERKMTPPVPTWLLNSGRRGSVESRNTRTRPTMTNDEAAVNAA